MSAPVTHDPDAVDDPHGHGERLERAFAGHLAGDEASALPPKGPHRNPTDAELREAYQKGHDLAPEGADRHAAGLRAAVRKAVAVWTSTLDPQAGEASE